MIVAQVATATHPRICNFRREESPVYNNPFKPAGAVGVANNPTAIVPQIPFAQ